MANVESMTQMPSQDLISIDRAVIQNLWTLNPEEFLDVVRRLHRVFRATRSTIADGVARRLENYFWRLWSSPKLMETVAVEQLWRHFMLISQGGDIRTTPVGSPRVTTSSVNQGSTSATPFVLVLDEPAGRTFEDDAPEEPGQVPTPTPSSPYAHLRRPKLSVNGREDDTIGGPQDADISRGHNPQKFQSAAPETHTLKTGGRAVDSIVNAPEHKATTKSSGKAQSSKKRSAVVASTGTNRSKPGFVRRRSSQAARMKGSTVEDHTQPSDAACSPRSRPRVEGLRGYTRRNDVQTITNPRESIGQRNGGGDGHRADDNGDQRIEKAQRKYWRLIPRPDRSSGGTLAPEERKSNIAAAAAASFQASGMLDIGQAPLLSTTQQNERPYEAAIRLREANTAKPRPTAAPPPLPGRSRSQLTEMLKNGKV